MAVQKHRLRAVMLYFRTTKLARGMFSFPRFHNTTLPGHLFDFKKRMPYKNVLDAMHYFLKDRGRCQSYSIWFVKLR